MDFVLFLLNVVQNIAAEKGKLREVKDNLSSQVICKKNVLLQTTTSPQFSEKNPATQCTLCTCFFYYHLSHSVSVLNFFFSPSAPLNITTSHTCSLQCKTQTGAGTSRLINAYCINKHSFRKCGMSSRIPLSMGGHELLVLLIGRGWPINAPVLGPELWLSAWW